MRRSWLYLAMRSVREAEPVLICPALVATARSAMKVSSVSPERWRDDGGIAVAAGELDGVEGLGDGADLIDLDEDGVGDFLRDALLEAFGVGDEEVVADELDLMADEIGEVFPAGPVVFGEAVLDGQDGVLAGPVGPELGHLFGGEFALIGLLEGVLAGGFGEELAGGGVEGEGDVVEWAEAGLGGWLRG